MFGLEDTLCCGREYYEGQEHIPLLLSPDSKTYPEIIVDHCDAFGIDDGRFAQELTLEEKQNGYLALYNTTEFTHSIYIVAPTIPSHWDSWCLDAPLQDKFSVLNDWATILHAYHAKDEVHGKLTPGSVGIVDGRGILLNRGLSWPGKLSRTKESPGDDVFNARWEAMEHFCLDNSNSRPTKMSDIYSFACLMLQVLTGTVPYCGTKRPEQVVYLKYLGREPIDAQTPKIADRYVTFMRQCWFPEPEKRPTMGKVVGFIHEEIKRLGERRN